MLKLMDTKFPKYSKKRPKVLRTCSHYVPDHSVMVPDMSQRDLLVNEWGVPSSAKLADEQSLALKTSSNSADSDCDLKSTF